MREKSTLRRCPRHGSLKRGRGDFSLPARSRSRLREAPAPAGVGRSAKAGRPLEREAKASPTERPRKSEALLPPKTLIFLLFQIYPKK